MATLAWLQAEIVAVSSVWFSVVGEKPPEKSTTILRPGISRKFLARLRTARSMLRAPKSAAALLREENPRPGDKPADATVTEASEDAFGSTEELLTPETAARRVSAFAVKFWRIRRVPPKSTTAIK